MDSDKDGTPDHLDRDPYGKWCKKDCKSEKIQQNN
jgi:hypothetical protein